jgi:hypothetical protein
MKFIHDDTGLLCTSFDASIRHVPTRTLDRFGPEYCHLPGIPFDRRPKATPTAVV